MHPKYSRPLSILALGAALVSAPACTLSKMKPPQSLLAHAMPVKTTGGVFTEPTFDLGRWSVNDVDRDWTSSTQSSWSIGFFGKGSTKATQAYRFSLHDKGVRALRVECLTRVEQASVEYGDLAITDGQQQLGCRMLHTDSDELLGSVRANVSGRNRVGRVKVGERQLGLFTEHALEKGDPRFEPAGYVVKDGDSPVAAVQIVNTPAFWMSPAAQDISSHIIASLVALSLHRDITPKDTTSDND